MEQAISLIIAAFLLYTIALVSSRYYRIETAVMALGLGLILDSIGTWMMYDYYGGASLSLHAIAGYAGLILVYITFLIGIFTFRRPSKKAIDRFRTWLIWAWLVWTISLISGACTHLQ